ncbi:MAG TPA: 2-oxoacid:acceptor oxidoreductase family protein [Gemmatimonadales bacterium]|nr:2-oxoacid:acceptor oxidoreductase family protein [Gemmatimonadales bacterium]
MNAPSGVLRVRLSGRGGQGLILAGLVLAEAGSREGFHVVQTQSYGPEARLGASKSDVILSRGEIAFPGVTEPDVLLCLSRDAFTKYGGTVAVGGVRIVDRQVAAEVAVGDAVVLPLVDTAQSLGDTIVTNIVALGALVSLSGAAGRSTLRDALRGRVKPHLVEMNERALAAGWELGEAVTKAALAAAR